MTPEQNRYGKEQHMNRVCAPHRAARRLRRAAPGALSSILAASAAALVVAALVVPGTAVPARAEKKKEEVFTLSRLSVADRVLKLLAEDLNDDGLKDIVIFHRKGYAPRETRWISIFWQRASGTFATAADQSWEIDTTAAVIDVGDVSGDAKREIVYITPKDVRFYAIANGSYATRGTILFAAEGLAAFPAKETVACANFARDWNEDGRDDVCAFVIGGLAIYPRGAGGSFAAREMLPLDLRSRTRSASAEGDLNVTEALTASYYFPEVRFVPYDGDGRKDIVASEEDWIAAFCRDESGAYPRERARRVRFDLLTQKEKMEEIAEISSTIADINGDGYAEAFVTKQIAKGLTGFRAVINIFIGGPDGYKAKPDQVIISEGSASTMSLIRDVNGDGRLDLILPSIKISVAAIIRMLITKSIPVYFNVFLLKESGGYSDRPDFTKEVKFDIDFSGESDSQALDLDGDYNADKRRDFIFATGENELSIYLGIPNGGGELFAKKPSAKVEANAFGELMSEDLNGDGFSDMIVYYPESKNRWGTAEVLVNLKKIR